MLFSVVIPAHNAEPYLAAQLSALASQVDADPFEVIVVDNLSTDSTRDIAGAYTTKLDLRIVAAIEGHSAAYARNVGIREAQGEYLVFVDADDVVDRSLISAYRKMAGRYRIMGGRYEDTKLNDPRVAEWRYELTKDGLPVAFQRIRFFLMGNAAIHRSVFDDIGTFDEIFTHGGEEVDFSARAQLAGYEIGWLPDAIVYYRHRTSLRGLSRQYFDYGRAAAYVHARYRERAGLPRTTLKDTAHALWAVFPHAVDLARGNRRRGRWVLLSSFYVGEAIESVRQGSWYLGG